MLRSCSVNHRRLNIVASGVGFRCTARGGIFVVVLSGSQISAAVPLRQIRSLLFERCVWKSESYSCNSVSAMNSWTGRRVTGDVDGYPLLILTEDEFPADHHRVYEDERYWNGRTNSSHICKENIFRKYLFALLHGLPCSTLLPLYNRYLILVEMHGIVAGRKSACSRRNVGQFVRFVTDFLCLPDKHLRFLKARVMRAWPEL